MSLLFCNDNRSKQVQNIIKHIDANEPIYKIEEQLTVTKLRDNEIIFLRDLVFQYMDCIDDERREKLEIKIYRMVYK